MMDIQKDGMSRFPIPYIVEFTWDNGAVLEDMRAVCMAFADGDEKITAASGPHKYS